MKKNLVVCGMDGSGKTTLIEYLRKDYPQLGEVRRACTAEGPVEDVVGWTKHDVLYTRERGLYDRHPLVSGRVYPAVLGTPAQYSARDLFNLTRRWARNTVIVHCDPSLATIKANLAADKGVQMAGVREHVDELYRQYYVALRHLDNDYGLIVWPYDYRAYSEYDLLCQLIERIVL